MTERKLKILNCSGLGSLNRFRLIASNSLCWSFLLSFENSGNQFVVYSHISLKLVDLILFACRGFVRIGFGKGEYSQVE